MTLPYFPMFPKDYVSKTHHLTLLEHGVYHNLLCLCWMTAGCSVPADEAWIMRRLHARTEEEQDAVRTVLAEFFEVRRGRIHNPQLTKIWQEAHDAHERRVKAGAKGGARKSRKLNDSEPSNASPELKQPEPEPESYRGDSPPLPPRGAASMPQLKLVHTEPPPELAPDPFDEFWRQYPHRGGAKKGKAPARKAWVRAINAGARPDQIITGALRYATDRQVLRGYAKDPSTWLNQKGWTDDIEHDCAATAADGSRRYGGVADSAARFIARLEAGSCGGGESCG